MLSEIGHFFVKKMQLLVFHLPRMSFMSIKTMLASMFSELFETELDMGNIYLID